MTLYLRSRATGAVILTSLLGLGAIALPIAAIRATPSPVGATSALGVMLALIPAVAAAWGCSRGDATLESAGVRPVPGLDLLFVLTVTGAAALSAFLLGWAGIAPMGPGAGRAIVTFAGLLLFAVPFGWRTAATLPSAYVIAVLVLGRGEDAEHPAVWAWIAAPVGDVGAWAASLLLVSTAVVSYLIWSTFRLGGAR